MAEYFIQRNVTKFSTFCPNVDCDEYRNTFEAEPIYSHPYNDYHRISCESCRMSWKIWKDGKHEYDSVESCHCCGRFHPPEKMDCDCCSACLEPHCEQCAGVPQKDFDPGYKGGVVDILCTECQHEEERRDEQLQDQHSESPEIAELGYREGGRDPYDTRE